MGSYSTGSQDYVMVGYEQGPYTTYICTAMLKPRGPSMAFKIQLDKVNYKKDSLATNWA